MRIFVGIDLDSEVRAKIARFLEGVRGFAPEVRWVRPESLHVTLKFIGEQKPERVEEIKEKLRQVEGKQVDIRFAGYGFFPTPKSARVFWVGMESGPELAALAAAIDEKTAAHGIPREERRFSPHLTLARASGASGAPRRQAGDRTSRVFALLQERLGNLPAPEFGTMTPHEFFLYQSQLSPKGSKYTKLASFRLQS